MTPIVRARLLGGLIVVLAFAAGVATGRFWPRTQPDGITVMIKETDRIPDEIDRLGLSDSQRVMVHGILRRGAMRVDSLVQGFMPLMHGAVTVTDSEIRTVLTTEQRASFDAERKAHPPQTVNRRKIIKSER